MLTYMVHSEDQPPVVISLHGREGGCITDLPSVTSQFQTFLAELYTSRAPPDEVTMQDFPMGVLFPQLMEEQVFLLEAALTTYEKSEAIASFARSKAPGSRWLTHRVLYTVL